MRQVYADNNATTCVAPEVVAAMEPFLRDHYGNPSSMHHFGEVVEKHIKAAREQVAAFLNTDPEEIVFTSCGTESDNAAIYSTILSYPEKHHIITTKVEHNAVLHYCRHHQKNGHRLTELSVNRQGQIDLDELEASLSDDTVLVTIMYANNETGVIFPIEKIGEMVKSRGIIFHTDAVQAGGKIPLDLKSLPVDLLSLSGHKIHAPKGIGVLYIRKGTRFSPLLIGGHQERGRRGGTENTTGIIGLGKACELAAKNMERENTEVKKLRDKLERELLKKVPQSRVNGAAVQRLPNTTNISFEFVEGEAILLLMNELGICASSGSACTSGSLQPSHVLRAMGVPFTMAHGSIRFSLSVYNTEAEIDFVIEHMPAIIYRLRGMSPYWTSSAQACSNN